MNATETERALASPGVLLVEDEPHIRRFLRSALQAQGCQVWEAPTLQRGLIEAASRQPDLLILDLGLPDGDGVQLVQELRGWSQLPVLILSARSLSSRISTQTATASRRITAKPLSFTRKPPKPVTATR